MQEKKITFNIGDASDAYIDSFTKQFIEINSHVINGLCYNFYKESSKVAMMAFQEIMHEELRKACYSFVNNGHNPDYIDSYLFASIHKTIKNMNNEGKNTVYICPGCKHFSKIEILEQFSRKLICNVCKNALNSVKDAWEENIYKTFAEHSRKGYACPDCDNFIPDTGNEKISCPFPNCFFAGNVADLKVARHPAIKANLEIPRIVQDPADAKAADTEMIVKDDLNEYMHILKDCIESQIHLLHYKTNESTLISKMCMYDAYKNIIDKYPNEMISYLVLLNRNVRMQHKIFQEFVRLLESKIPFTFKKNGGFYEISSLLDDNLCIFDGESVFNAIVDDNLEIPNLTEELYVGSRKGTYCRPFYIGKVLEIINTDSNCNITDSISEHSFFKITMKDNIKPGTNVQVKHLRIFPHYQMGGMVYLNRIRRLIVDKVYFTIHGKKREVRR